MNNFTQTLLIALLVTTLYACSGTPVYEGVHSPSDPVQPVLAPAHDGTIYQRGAEVRLFEDLKAGRVGDILNGDVFLFHNHQISGYLGTEWKHPKNDHSFC